MSFKKMAGNQLLKLGLIGLGMGNIVAGMPALAAPAPVFEPMIDELATSKFEIRLPTSIPADVELYPFSRPIHPGIHILTVGTTPECSGERCLAFNIVTIPEPNTWPTPEENRLTPLTPIVLGNGIQGYTAEARGFASVEWMQDGTLYILNYSTELLSFEDAIAMATSMAIEPPVSESQ
ncbi:hypothetical protein [Leptolyngbya sp. Heron Island J]|uniref:hypothetical protein n=1 Tax=Leptolyngbya sp. Heron Island J TaxID=1385935 RepID=UPI0004145ABD|nr:hypothetical protein [Leptolyngbya sp. Heron Island J]